MRLKASLADLAARCELEKRPNPQRVIKVQGPFRVAAQPEIHLPERLVLAVLWMGLYTTPEGEVREILFYQLTEFKEPLLSDENALLNRAQRIYEGMKNTSAECGVVDGKIYDPKFKRDEACGGFSLIPFPSGMAELEAMKVNAVGLPSLPFPSAQEVESAFMAAVKGFDAAPALRDDDELQQALRPFKQQV